MSRSNRDTAKKEARRKQRELLLSNTSLSNEDKVHILNAEIKSLKGQIRESVADQMSAAQIKSTIFEIASGEIDPPKWLLQSRKPSSKTLGIPTIFASDWHYGEKVFPAQIEYCNDYNLEIADRRIQNLVNNSIDILFNHLSNPHYEGLVFPLGGDMFSGDIHEELAKTNELPMFPTLLRLTGRLVWAIKVYADKFGKVFVPVVAGNHGRTTRKPTHKNRAFDNFDWMLGCMLAREFANDKRVTVVVSDGTDINYSIYGHKYLLTHGDQFSGGDSIIGAIGPVTRGDSKKRNRESQIGRPYDTMICGHFHQLVVMKKIVINGSLKGYDEYAYAHNFPFERPQQAMWLTHPEHGITFNMPIFVEESKRKGNHKPLEF
jgi:predicted phosphodiesterase